MFVFDYIIQKYSKLKLKQSILFFLTRFFICAKPPNIHTPCEDVALQSYHQ